MKIKRYKIPFGHVHCNECDTIQEQGTFLYSIYTKECLEDIFVEFDDAAYFIPNLCEDCLRKLGKSIERELKRAEGRVKKLVD
jgi:hypothetical protein